MVAFTRSSDEMNHALGRVHDGRPNSDADIAVEVPHRDHAVVDDAFVGAAAIGSLMASQLRSIFDAGLWAAAGAFVVASLLVAWLICCISKRRSARR
jgi:hypothetical protein